MKRPPPWKLLCGIAAGLLALIAVFFAWVQATASRRWAELVDKVPLLILEARNRESKRPVLRGEAVPGNAWDDYNQALAAIKGVKSSDLGEYVSRGKKADRAAVEAILALHEGTLGLDASWPDHAESMLNEGVGAAAGLMKEDMVSLGFGEGTLGLLSAWRYGFSLRLLIADAVDTHLDFMRRHAAACRSWAESERTGKELDAECQASSNPVVRIAVPGLVSSHRPGVERRAQLSLLRMAVALRAGQPLELLDPFDGAKLRSDGTKLWSVGADGVDGGGIGAWRPQKTGDIVLDLKKK